MRHPNSRPPGVVGLSACLTHLSLPRAAFLISAAWALCFSVWSAPAAANDLFVLDAQATSPGHLVEDSAGNAYVGWTHRSASASVPDAPMFCKIPVGGSCAHPVTLPIPGATSITDEVSGVFPVLGSGATVYVVAPRYVEDDLIIWESTNGGESFNAGTITKGGYSSKTAPTNVLLSGSNLLISAYNAGLGFSSAPAAGGSGEAFEFESIGSGGVVGSSLGLDSAGQLVDSYWELSEPDSVHFYRYKGSGSLGSEKDWEGPFAVTNGYESKLSGGSAGLFLVSEDYGTGSAYPDVLNVRKYNGTSFGAPLTLASGPSFGLFTGGAIAQSPDGSRVAVAWPASSNESPDMRLFASTNGGTSFGAATDIAHIGDAYAGFDNAQLAIGNGGQGWLTFMDSSGLRVADLTPVANPAPTPTPTPKTPPTYKGKTHTSSAAVEGNLLTLKVPGMCLESEQPFYVGVGKKARHRVARALRTKMKVAKVTFSFDGMKKTLKKEAVSLVDHPGSADARQEIHGSGQGYGDNPKARPQ